MVSCLRADRQPLPEQELSALPKEEEVEVQEQVPALVEPVLDEPVLDLQEPEAPLTPSRLWTPATPSTPSRLQTPATPSTPSRLGIVPTRRSEGFRSRSSRRRSTSPQPSPIRSPRMSLLDSYESSPQAKAKAKKYKCRNKCSLERSFTSISARNRHERFECSELQQVITSTSLMSLIHLCLFTGVSPFFEKFQCCSFTFCVGT